MRIGSNGVGSLVLFDLIRIVRFLFLSVGARYEYESVTIITGEFFHTNDTVRCSPVA